MASIVGTARADTLTGGDDPDLIDGGDGDDRLDGGAGDDQLLGGAGADTLVGGAGNDFFSLDSPDDLVVESADGGFDTVMLVGAAALTYTMPEQIEALAFASAYRDPRPIDITGNAFTNGIVSNDRPGRVDAGAGSDYVLTGAGDNTLIGGEGDDTLMAGFGQALIDGGAGNDSLRAQGDDAYADTLSGGAGDDSLYTDSGYSSLSGGDGRDSLTGNAVGSTFEAGAGDDLLTAITLNNLSQRGLPGSTLRGGPGDDVYLLGVASVAVVELPGEGFDRVSVEHTPGALFVWPENVEALTVGGRLTPPGDTFPPMTVRATTGDDSIRAGGGVVVEGMTGNDTLEGAGTLLGGEGDDVLRSSDFGGVPTVLEGGPGRDRIDAGNFGDRLFGGADDDTLVGYGGADTLSGGEGFDELIGGGGGDTYVLDDLDDLIDEQGTDPADIDVVIARVNGAKIDRARIEEVRYENGALPLAYWVDALTYGFSWGPMGQAAEVRIGFADQVDVEGFTPFAAADVSAAEQALAMWSTGTGLSWRVVPADQADVLFGFAELDGLDAAGITVALPGREALHVFIDDAGQGGQTGSDPNWQRVLLHEVGHALGLKHPGDYDDRDQTDPPPFLPAVEDSTRWTVMSYIVAEPSAGLLQSLPLLDSAAAQYLYGVAPSIAAGSTRWALTEVLSAGPLLVDGDGEDTLDASAAGPGIDVLTLDLRPGSRSGYGIAAEHISAAGQFSIGYGSAIEHALGSSGADRITGNWAANRLEGGAGADTLYGVVGRDSLLGGGGDDLLLGSALEPVAVDGGAGDDRIELDASTLSASLAWPVGSATVEGGAGSDTLVLRIDPAKLDPSLARQLMQLRAQLASNSEAPLWPIGGVEHLELRGVDGAALPNLAPFMEPQTFTLDEDGSWTGRLGATFDLEGQPISMAVAAQANGQFSLSADGDLSFTPLPNVSGRFPFRLLLTDGSSRRVVEHAFMVRPVNDAPRAAEPDMIAVATAGHDLVLDLAAMVPDIDSADVTRTVRVAAGGSLPDWLAAAGTSVTDQSLLGRPQSADAGLLNLEVTASDGQATVVVPFRLYVNATENSPPYPSALDVRTVSGQAVDLPTVVDPDGDAVHIEVLTPPTNGTVSVGSGGRWRYVPPADYHGTELIRVRISDDRGGRRDFDVIVRVDAPDLPPTGELRIVGVPKLGELLTAVLDVVEPDGISGQIVFRWWTEGVYSEATGTQYRVIPDAVGHTAVASAMYIDGKGHTVRFETRIELLTPSLQKQEGSDEADRITLAAPAWLLGRHGDDTLTGSGGDDIVDAGVGDDRVVVSGGSDTLFGGHGRDTLVMAAGYTHLNLQDAALERPSLPTQRVVGFENVIGTAAAETIVGADLGFDQVGDVIKGFGGGDSIDGGGGIDYIEFTASRDSYTVEYDGSTARLTVAPIAGGPSDRLIDVERLLFADQLLCFGERALEVAEAAFALWGPGIASSRQLFARGISFYDVGWPRTFMLDIAVGFFGGDSDLEFAQRLFANVPGARSTSELLALLQNGYSRGHVTGLVADDPVNLRSIELAGFLEHGIAASLGWDGGPLFQPLPQG